MAPLLSHLLQRCRWFSTIMVFIYALFLSLSASQQLIVTIEDPKMTGPSVDIQAHGRVIFDNFSGNPALSLKIGENQWEVIYYDLKIQAGQWAGGSGGGGHYPYTEQGGSLRFNVYPLPGNTGGGPTYFGMWASVFLETHTVTFKYQGEILYTSHEELYARLPKLDGYFKAPWHTKPDETKQQAWVFFNFFFNTTYDEIILSAPVGQFHTDNHSFGRWTKSSCSTEIYRGHPLTLPPTIPPPTTPPPTTLQQNIPAHPQYVPAHPQYVPGHPFVPTGHQPFAPQPFRPQPPRAQPMYLDATQMGHSPIAVSVVGLLLVLFLV